jgi:hypothetical protein
MMDLLRAEGFVAGDVAAEDVLRYIGALGDPLRVERFHFHRAWMARQGERVANLRGRAYWETGRALTLPAQHMLVARVLSGWVNILAQLDCTVAARGLAERWMPGFAGDASRYDAVARSRDRRPALVDQPVPSLTLMPPVAEAPGPSTGVNGCGRIGRSDVERVGTPGFAGDRAADLQGNPLVRGVDAASAVGSCAQVGPPRPRHDHHGRRTVRRPVLCPVLGRRRCPGDPARRCDLLPATTTLSTPDRSIAGLDATGSAPSMVFAILLAHADEVSSPSPVSPITCSVWRSRTIGGGNAPHLPPPNRTVAEYIPLRPRRGSASRPVPANVGSSQCQRRSPQTLRINSKVHGYGGKTDPYRVPV